MQFSQAHYESVRLQCKELSRDELYLVLLGQISALLSNNQATNSKKARQRSNMAFYHGGVRICRTTFQKLHGIGIRIMCTHSHKTHTHLLTFSHTATPHTPNTHTHTHTHTHTQHIHPHPSPPHTHTHIHRRTLTHKLVHMLIVILCTSQPTQTQTQTLNAGRRKGLVHTDCACTNLYPKSGYIVYSRKIFSKLSI